MVSKGSIQEEAMFRFISMGGDTSGEVCDTGQGSLHVAVLGARATLAQVS